jgi:hypothetical protein
LGSWGGDDRCWQAGFRNDLFRFAPALIKPPQTRQCGSGYDARNGQTQKRFFSDIFVFRHPIFSWHSGLLSTLWMRASPLF